MEKKQILIIHTGGTIGMVRTENGYAPQSGALLEELNQIRDLRSPEMPDWDLIEFDPLLDSTNIRYEQWNSIAGAISRHYGEYDGFVVLHGTDTLAYPILSRTALLPCPSCSKVLTSLSSLRARRYLYANSGATGATTSLPR